MRSANRERPRVSAPQRSGRMPFAGLSLGDPAASPLRYLILAAGLAMLAFAALLAHKENLAVIAVGCSAVLPLALRRVSAVALALIPVMVLSVTPLHSAKPALIAVGLLAVAAVVRVCTGSLRLRSPHLWVAVLFVMVLLAYFLPADPLVSGRGIQSTLIWTIGGLLVLTVCIASPPATSALLGVILATGAISGVVASIQRDYVGGRLQGLGLNPNYFAIYLAVPIVISIGLAARHRNLLWLAPAATCLPALLATKSRAGFLAMAAGVVFLIVQRGSRRQKMLIALISVIALLAALVFPVNLSELVSLGAGNRSAVELGSDNLVRSQVALFALHTVLTHPLLGIGFGQFPQYAAVSSSFGIYITTTNEYLLLASETGLIALAAFLMLLWPALRKSAHGDMAIVRAVIATAAVSMLFVDTFGTLIVAVPFWACLGALLGHRPGQPGLEPAGRPPDHGGRPAESIT